MSLLREIQDLASGDHTSVTSLLRKCKILAVRLKSHEFGTWVDQELGGYRDLDALPDYRIFPVRSYGTFVGPTGQLKNAPISLSALPEELRDSVGTMRLTWAISVVADSAETQSSADIPWPAEVLPLLSGGRVYQGMNCLSAWRSVPRSTLAAILDAVKTRVLNFALQLEQEAPGAGTDSEAGQRIPDGRVSQIFNTYISGNVQNVATGSRDFSQSAGNLVAPGNFDSLAAVLRSKVGASEADIMELDVALKHDAAHEEAGSLGSRTLAWLSKMIKKAGTGALSVGAKVATEVLTGELTKYVERQM